MKYISQKEYENRLKQIKLHNLNKKRILNLKKEESKYKKKIKLPSTSKMILLGAVLLCLEIVIFSEYAMLKLGDTSAMYALIGVPATLIPIIWGYYSKAKAENTSGGITYEMAMEELKNQNNSSDDIPMG